MAALALPLVPPLVEGIKWLGIAIGAAILGTTAAGVVNEARRDAETRALPAEDGAVCNCDPPPPPRCRDLENGMREDARTIDRRIQDMKADRHNLFDNHYGEFQAHPVYGSWMGHVRQIRQVQRSLERKRRESEELGCPKPSSSILRWLRSSAPDRPRGPYGE